MAVTPGEPNPRGQATTISAGEEIRPRDWRVLAGLVIGALLLALATLAHPRVPSEADMEATADASWCAVLEFAHQHGLQFGTEIAFTYGPLGFLAMPYAWSTPSPLRLLSDLWLSFSCALGICLNARRLGRVRAIVLIGVYLFLLANIYPRADLLIELNLLGWGLLCIWSTNPIRLLSTLILADIAVFAGLVKVTLLVMAILTIGMVIGNHLLRRDGRLALGLAGLVATGLVATWMATGQSLSHLPIFFNRGLITSLGYNSAMGYEGSLLLRGRAILVAFLAAVTIVTAAAGCRFDGQTRFVKTRRLFLAGWLLGMLFLVWKHGFVRTDLYHAGFFFGFAPVLALLAGGVSPANSASEPSVKGEPKENQRLSQWARLAFRPGFWPKLFAVSCGLVSLLTVQNLVLPGDWKASLQQPLAAVPASLSVLTAPGAYAQQLGQALQAERQRYQLPVLRAQIGRSTVDMFGCEQISLLANDLNYRPRPVFQSYAAYSAPLMEWNEAFYKTATAPEYVLFRLSGMDRKFPPLEDAFLFRHLLLNYRPVTNEPPFLLLQSNRNESPRLTLLREGTARSGELVSLAEYGETNLWLQLDLKETFLGRLRHLFYQPAKSRLVVSPGANAQSSARRFRAPAAMLAAGCLISPLVLNNDDVLALYNGEHLTRPKACAIEFNPGDGKFWRETFSFRIYRIENKLGTQPRLLSSAR